MAKKKKSLPEVDIEQTLLQHRKLYLFEPIGDVQTWKLIKAIKVLDLQEEKPIELWLDTPGGSVSTGFALINVMKSCKSEIITIVNSEVASMGSLIFIAGDKRLIVPNGFVMLHDSSAGLDGDDYTTKNIARMKFLEKHQELIFKFIKRNTKLTNSQIREAQHAELWLDSNAALKYGVADGLFPMQK